MARGVVISMLRAKPRFDFLEATKGSVDGLQEGLKYNGCSSGGPTRSLPPRRISDAMAVLALRHLVRT